MSLIDDLIPVVDDARRVIDQIGFRIHEVKLVTLTWELGKTGIGAPTDKDEVLMDPQPKVLRYRMDKEINSGGAIYDADLEVSKISKTYTLGDLMGGSLPANKEFFWEIDGELYNPIAYQEKAIGWNIWLRRTNRRYA